MNGNNNYRCLRKTNEEIYFNAYKKERSNLILAVDENNAIYWEIKRENTTEEIFLNFIKI